MKNALPITLLIVCLGAGIFVKLISTPDTAMSNWFDTKAVPTMQEKIRAVQRLPYVRLLDWEDKNDYHRQSLQQLEVVSPSATGYTPEELAEIYPTK